MTTKLIKIFTNSQLLYDVWIIDFYISVQNDRTDELHYNVTEKVFFSAFHLGGKTTENTLKQFSGFFVEIYF